MADEEVGGQEGQDEQREVAGVELRIALDRQPEQGRDLDHECGGGSQADREREAVPTRGAGLGIVGDELLPEPVGVLAGELTRQLVDPAHPADSDEERLLAGEAG